jgi:DHA1 family tetracycline resistance protein-like MFS transporter
MQIRKIVPSLSGELWSILSINFIGTLGFTIVIPFLAVLVNNLGGNAIVYAFIASLYPLFQFLGSPILGYFSDKFGRRSVLLISQLGTLISWIVFLIALFLPINTIIAIESEFFGKLVITLPILIIAIARSLDGITGGNVAVTQAYVADISTSTNKSKNFGYLTVSSQLGSVIGPALAGILSITILGAKLPVIFAIILSLAALVGIWIYIKDSKKEKEINFTFSDLFQLNKRIKFLLIIYMLLFVGFNMYYATFPIHVIEVFNWAEAEIGIYFSLLSLLLIIVQGPVLAIVSKQLHETTLIVFGTFILSVYFLGISVPNTIVAYISLVFFAVGNGLMWPSMLSYLSTLAPKDLQGSVQGIASSVGGIASLLGLLIGGFLYEAIKIDLYLFTGVFIICIGFISIPLLSRGSSGK